MLKRLFGRSKSDSKPVESTITEEPSFEDTVDKLIKKYIRIEYLIQYCPLNTTIVTNDPNKTYELVVRPHSYGTRYSVAIRSKNVGDTFYFYLSIDELCKFILIHFNEIVKALQNINDIETEKVLDRQQREQDFKRCTKKLIDKVNQNL